MRKYIPALCIVIAITIAPLSVAESNHGDSKTVTQDHDLAHHDTAYFAQPLTPMSCDDLHPVTSKADLIRQLYGTALLNDCLYEMDTQELQRIWKIPVEDPYLPSQGVYSSSLNTSLNLKVEKLEGYHYPKDSDKTEVLYMYAISFLNSPFKTDSMNPVDLTLFPEGYFPEAFGEPLEVPAEDDWSYAWSLYSQKLPTQYYNRRDANRNDIEQATIYYWLSPDSQQRMVAPTHPIGAVPSLYFNQHNFSYSAFGAPGSTTP